MLTKVSVKFPAQNIDPSSSPPNQHDQNEILDILNKGRLCERISPPEGNVEDFVAKSLNQFIANNPPLTIPNCHSISKLVAEKSPYELNRVAGYLIKKSVEANFRNATPLHLSYPPFFSLCEQTENVETWLHHHSVVRNSQGELIECLPHGWYPFEDFVFICHHSGAKGWFLAAS
jgi:hypothetical protein